MILPATEHVHHNNTESLAIMQKQQSFKILNADLCNNPNVGLQQTHIPGNIAVITPCKVSDIKFSLLTGVPLFNVPDSW